jgi:DNA-binding MarR family transcriptional regulator
MADEHAVAQISLALRRVLQAGREMQAALARRLGVRVTDVAALDHVVSADDPLGTTELGDRLGIRSASAAVLVDRLVAARHLRRRPHPGDRRRVILAATEHARGQVRHELAPLVDELATITRRLDDEQAATVLSFLTDAAAAMRRFSTPPLADEAARE